MASLVALNCKRNMEKMYQVSSYVGDQAGVQIKLVMVCLPVVNRSSQSLVAGGTWKKNKLLNYSLCWHFVYTYVATE